MTKSMRAMLPAAAMTLTLVFGGALAAHEGHTHKALGTVTKIDGTHVTVKTTAGKTIVVMLDDKTAITRDKEKVTASALKVGERLSVDYVQEKDMLMAHAIKLAKAAR